MGGGFGEVLSIFEKGVGLLLHAGRTGNRSLLGIRLADTSKHGASHEPPLGRYDAPCIQAGCTGAALYYRDPILPGTPGLYSPVLGPAGLALARAGGKLCTKTA